MQKGDCLADGPATGQEGFGLMACDNVGKNGDSATFWNNSYMASVTKVKYTTDAGKYSMKLGVGSQEKVGVTPENINASLQLDDMSLFSSTMRTLETSCADAGKDPGTYNLVGNYTNNPGPDGTVDPALTEFVLTVEKNNTGYFVSYTDAAGVTHTEKYYDTQALWIPTPCTGASSHPGMPRWSSPTLHSPPPIPPRILPPRSSP